MLMLGIAVLSISTIDSVKTVELVKAKVWNTFVRITLEKKV
jgi:hypothetical protein